MTDATLIPDTVKFWYMHDDHAFSPLTGKTLDDILFMCNKIRASSTWGMLCPAILLKGNVEVRRVGTGAHCHGKDKNQKWIDECAKWAREMKADKDVMRIMNVEMPSAMPLKSDCVHVDVCGKRGKELCVFKCKYYTTTNDHLFERMEISMKKGHLVRMKSGEEYRNKYQILSIFQNIDNPEESLAQVSYVESMGAPRTTFISLDALEPIPPKDKK